MLSGKALIPKLAIPDSSCVSSIGTELYVSGACSGGYVTCDASSQPQLLADGQDVPVVEANAPAETNNDLLSCG